MRTINFYSALFKSIAGRNDIKIEKYKLRYKGGKYELIKIFSKNIGPRDRVVLISAGVHGNEVAGPFTILKRANQIIDYIHKNNLKFILYPIENPSGFDVGKRYNIDGDEGFVGNNDFLRYELKNGKFVDDIFGREQFKKWHWTSCRRFLAGLPSETKLMHRLLKKDPLGQIVAAIDLHQDRITPNVGPATYAYPFGDLHVYENIIKKIERIIPILRNKRIDAGQKSAMKSDNNGFIIRHDGTLPDLMYRIGARYCVTIEVTGKTPINMACKVNLTWIFGIVDLIKNI